MDRCVCVLWQRLGPYHLARFRAAEKSLATEGFKLIGIQVADADEYPWRKVEDGNLSAAGGSASGGRPESSEDVAEEERCEALTNCTDKPRQHSDFQIRTLFLAENYRKVPNRKIKRAVQVALDELKPVAVAINGWSVPEAIAALGWCRQNGSVAILMSESHDICSKRFWLKELVKRWRVKRFDAALVGGRPHAECVQKLGMPADCVFLGYDAVDNAWFEKGAEEARADAKVLRTKLQLPEQYFFANARFLDWKNLDSLIRAYDLYRNAAASEPWGLVISGSGAEESSLKELASTLGLSRQDRTEQPPYAKDTAGSGPPSADRFPPSAFLSGTAPVSGLILQPSAFPEVIFTGFLQYDDLPTYYGLASAFCHPARREAWGLVVNEAAAVGLPLIVSNTVGSRYELVKDGENGLLFDPANVGDLAECLRKVSAMPSEQLSAWGMASRRIVSAFGPERFGQGLRDALKSCGVI